MTNKCPHTCPFGEWLCCNICDKRQGCDKKCNGLMPCD